jgi:hypothetical protein
MDYTVQADMEMADGEWHLGERVNVTDDRDIEEFADWAATHYTVADGADWRVRVWLGHDAPEDATPVADVGVNWYEP